MSDSDERLASAKIGMTALMLAIYIEWVLQRFLLNIRKAAVSLSVLVNEWLQVQQTKWDANAKIYIPWLSLRIMIEGELFGITVKREVVS